VSDTVGNPSNVAVVKVNVQNSSKPTITAVSPPANGSGWYARNAVVEATFSCGDNVEVISCTATQTVSGTKKTVTAGQPIDTNSLIVGNTHQLTITASGFGGSLGTQTTTETVSYTVNTPHPAAGSFTVTMASTAKKLTVHVLTHVTSTFPVTPGSLKLVTTPKKGTATIVPGHLIQYSPRTVSTGVIHDAFTYEVKDIDGQLSNVGTVHVTIVPVPAITSLSRTGGPVAGGVTVTITGKGFLTVQKVTFGTTTAKTFSVRSATQIIATVPAHAAGQVRISVTTPGGTSPASSDDLFTYQ